MLKREMMLSFTTLMVLSITRYAVSYVKIMYIKPYLILFKV